MKMYQYRVDGQTYHLTEKEHEHVDGLIKKGWKGVIRLRQGQITFNIGMIAAVNLDKDASLIATAKTAPKQLEEGKLSPEEHKRLFGKYKPTFLYEKKVRT